MKFSLNSIRDMNRRYDSTGDVAKTGVDELIAKIGSQLGAIDEIIDLGAKYHGIVIAKVVVCDKHPDADKLQICKVDDGGVTKNVERDTDGLVQVVCGAPNAKAGLTVAWLPPGTTVPETVGAEPFVLQARELRGVVSNGMLASPKELALGDNHAGILEIDGDHTPGTDFAEAFHLADDKIIDIENKMFTHRPDLFGFLGLSRELAGIQGLSFNSPGWYVPQPDFPAPEADELPLTVRNELPELVPRFTAVALSGVRVGPSPVWLQVELAKIGAKSINNIVDYTNFFMLETGQPLHAYDYDKVKALSDGESATLVVRNPKPGEKVALLNGKTIEPRPEAIMIATDQQLIGMGGIMGGSDTEVDDGTTNIILESANFDMYTTRRTSMAHGLFTDAVTRFTKGQSPLQNLAVLSTIIDEIRQYAGGRVASPVIDDNHLETSTLERQALHVPVRVTYEFINQRLGLDLTAEAMQKLLQNVEFKVAISHDELIVTSPFWRTDIELREDVVEEVGRLYGFDRLPLELPRRDLTPTAKDPLMSLKDQLRDRLSRAGANELLTYSFVSDDLLRKVGQDPAKAFQIANALSPELQYYRISLIPSLLEKVHLNIKAGYDEFALFELGKTHSLDHGDDDDGVPTEYEFTALVVAANEKLKKPGTAYYQARQYLETLVGADKLEFKPVSDEMRGYPVVQPYDLERTAFVSVKDGAFLGIIGEFKTSVSRALKLPKFAAGFEIDTTVLQPLLAAGPSYIPLSRFPKVTQDLTLKVSVEVDFQILFDFVNQTVTSLRPADTRTVLSPVDIYQPDAKTKHVTLRLIVTADDRTLTDAEVNKLLEAAAAAAHDQYSAEQL